jgi:hypothetical protein
MYKKQLLVLFLGLLLLGVGYSFRKIKKESSLPINKQISEQTNIEQIIDNDIDLSTHSGTLTWKTYHDSQSGLTFKFPNDGIVYDIETGLNSDLISNFSSNRDISILRSGQYSIIIDFISYFNKPGNCGMKANNMKDVRLSDREVIFGFEKNDNNISYNACIFDTITGGIFIKVKTTDEDGDLAKDIFKTISFSIPGKRAYPPFKFYERYGLYGALEPMGYLRIDHWKCDPSNNPFCEGDVDYASFVMTNVDGIDSKALKSFFGENEGNSFVGQQSIGLGCYDKEKSIIHSVNEGDVGQAKNFINNNSLQKLLHSSKDNPVRLYMVKPVFTGGSEVPDCYSHFREFKVL